MEIAKLDLTILMKMSVQCFHVQYSPNISKQAFNLLKYGYSSTSRMNVSLCRANTRNRGRTTNHQLLRGTLFLKRKIENVSELLNDILVISEQKSHT